VALAELKDWIGVVSGLGVIASFVAINWLRGQFGTKEEHKETAKKVEALEDRVSKVEGHLDYLPDQASMHRMELDLSGMRGDLNVMAERMKAIASTGERLQEYLVDQAGRK
jgi:uncharacterized coiled-coil protein SlyX